MFKPGQGILKHLKAQGRDIDLPLDVLRQFQEYEKALQAALESYEGRDPAITYAMQSFTKVEALGVALIMSDAFPAARRAHDDVMKRFNKDRAFDDGVTLMSWLLFNFPASAGGVPLAPEVLNQAPPTLAGDIGPFIEEALGSRLGLYEVIKDDHDHCRLKELFTGKAVTLAQTLGGMGRGSITLCRVMPIGERHWAFGNAPEFPSSKRSVIQNMVEEKMFIYFPEDNDVKSYQAMMRLAGPYWFSIVAQDHRGDILNPDHYRHYYRA
jgi:hypothetical protein